MRDAYERSTALPGVRATGWGIAAMRRSRTSTARAAALLALSLLVGIAVLALAACGVGGSSWRPSGTPSWNSTMSPAPIPVVKPGQQLPAWSQILALFAYDRSEPLATQLGTADTFEQFGVTFTP
jgi:hypothetical protein